MLEITQKMEQVITEKETLTRKLNDLCDQQIALEIKEQNKRAKIFNKIEKEADGKKITDKTKNAAADEELKHDLNKIKHLKNSISKTRRAIEICNDKISLYRNMIRELEITK